MNRIMCVTVAFVLAGCNVDKVAPHEALGKDIAQTLMLDASGCVATGPDGNPLQLPAHLADGKILIPKGATFTRECFRDGDKNAGR